MSIHQPCSVLVLLTYASAFAAPALARQTDVDRYGCGTNPAGSLQRVGGAGTIGEVLVMGVDNPLETQPAGSLAFLAISTLPDPNAPCGTSLGGFGMVGPYGVGEFLVSLTPPNPVLIVGPVVWAGPGTPASLPVADWNGDLVPDIATANYGADSLGVLLGQGGGAFAAHVAYAVPDGPNHLAAVDIDRDGILDVAIAHDTNADLASVSFGRGDGTIGDAQPIPAAGDVPHHLAVGDFDGNGGPDVAFTNGQFAANRIVILLNLCP